MAPLSLHGIGQHIRAAGVRQGGAPISTLSQTTLEWAMPAAAPRSRAAKDRAARRWYVYLLLCRGDAIYTGIALDVAARYEQHLAGTGARYTRANPPRRLLARLPCPNQSVASKLEAAIKTLPAARKWQLIGMTGAAARKLLLEARGATRASLANTSERTVKNMSRKEPSFTERQLTSVEAKRTQLEKIRATALANGAQSAKRQTTRVETAEARSIRVAEQKTAKKVSADLRNAQRASEKARQAQALAEEKSRKEAARVARAAADAALAQEQKAARDSKYAARKARQK